MPRQYNCAMTASRAVLTAIALMGVTACGNALGFCGATVAKQSVSFPSQDGGMIYADMYGESDHGVVLAHGGRFKKDSWEGSERESDETATFTQLSSPAEPRGTRRWSPPSAWPSTADTAGSYSPGRG